MKRIKQLTSLLLALVMALSLSVGAMAAGNGSITIENTVKDADYTIYRLLDLESYDTTSGAYAYKANSAWKTWLETQNTYVSVDEQGYVTWVEGADAAAFAKAALEYAKANNIANNGTAKSTGENVVFNNLELGYYLVDSSVGALCALTTTKPNAEVKEKNDQPSVDKQVKEDSNNTWGKTNDADIGQTVEFKTTIHAKSGAQGYVLHDKMSEGLTLNQNSIAVNVGDKTLTKDTDYTVSFDTADECVFEITFKQEYLNTITGNTDIVVTYSAVLNENAVIYDAANPNDTKLVYGEKGEFETEWNQTKTYTFKFDIVKTDSSKKLLSGAKFELYDAQTGGNKIALVKESEGVYRVATTAEKSVEGFTSAVIEAGKATVKGLDGNTTYWLEEIEAPAGYNKLASRVEVKIEDSNLSTSMTGDTWAEGNGGVQITNQSGTKLPETGGMGTTIFYAVGGVLVLAAVVLLVTRKRMSSKG